MTARILLVRHGESEWNALGRWQGQADPPLSPAAEEQARRAALAVDVDAVVASDLVRASRTAELIADGRPVQLEPGLREIDVGEWSGLTSTEVEDRYPGMLARYRAGDLAGPPGGELRIAFLDRVVAAMHRLATRHRGRRVLGVTHGGVLNVLERHLGVYPGVGSPNLTGRWFVCGSELRTEGERVSLLDVAADDIPEIS